MLRSLSERLRELRAAKSLSTHQLARRAGLAQSTVHQLETGRRGRRPSARVLAALAAALGCDMTYLVEAQDVRENPRPP